MPLAWIQKTNRLRTVECTHQTYGVSVRHACRRLGMSPQAYYQARWRAQRRQAQEDMVLALFQTIRARHPRMSVRKIYRLIRS